MISVKQVRQILSENSEKGKTSKVRLQESLGCILAAPVVSPIDVPSFDNSAMDGYAMSFHGEEKLWIQIGVVQAGAATSASVKEGETLRIFTGAKIPEGADTVIPQELVEVNDKAITYKGEKIEKGSNVRLRGSQCRKGDLLLEPGAKITPGVIGLMASVGIAEAEVYTSPSVACIITGNELKEVGEELLEGEIYNSNGPMLEACLNQIGIDKTEVFKATDEKEKLQEIILNALARHEFLILSGGISVGDYDFVKECLEAAGVKELVYKVKQRPGKPFFAGKKQEKWIFALPGNPASVLSCFVQYVQPCLKYWMGHERVWEPEEELELKEEVKKKAGFTFFMKARKEGGKVRVLGGQQSFNLISFNLADCLVELEEETETFPKGTRVNVYPL